MRWGAPGSPSSASARMAAPGSLPVRLPRWRRLRSRRRQAASRPSAPLSCPSLPWPSPIAQGYTAILARRGAPTCVLATGDPFHFGVGAELARLVAAEEIACFPQVSAFSLAAARLGWSLPECDCVSLHGRAVEQIIPHLQPGARILALSWDGSTPAQLAALSSERGFGASTMTILEAMGGPGERIRRVTAADCDAADVAALNTVAIEVAGAPGAQVVTLAPGLADSWFENDGQLTKAEIRALTLAARAAGRGTPLGHRHGRRLDRHRMVPASPPQSLHRFGGAPRAGRAGARQCAPSRRDPPRGRQRAGTRGASGAPAAAGDLHRRRRLAAPGCSSAPGSLAGGGRLVVNAVTLETETLLGALHARYGGSMARFALFRLEGVGKMHGWRAAMPVTQWMVTKR